MYREEDPTTQAERLADKISRRVNIEDTEQPPWPRWNLGPLCRESHPTRLQKLINHLRKEDKSSPGR